MINPLEEKKMLIESMKKLVSHVSTNPQRQNEIFQALSTQDLNKILVNLRDDNEYLRRISSLLLCELFFMNEETKQKATRLLQLVPNRGRICLGGIPESISKYPSTLRRCVELMKSPLQEGEELKMCWVINLERKILKIEIMDYKKYSSFTFIDPYKNIFGFTCKPTPEAEKIVLNPVTPKREYANQLGRNHESSSQYQQGRSHESSSQYQQASQVNSEFYKTYVDARKKTSQSKRNSFQGNYINLSVNSQTDRPTATYKQTMSPHANSSTVQTPKRESLRNTIDYSSKIGSNLTMTVGRNSMGGQKILNSTYIPGHYTNLNKASTIHYSRFQPSDPRREEAKARGPRFGLGFKSDPAHLDTVSVQTQDRFYQKGREAVHK